MTSAAIDGFVTAMKAMARRLTAENTWLRHSLMEIEQRVERMQVQLTHLETRAKALRKTLSATAGPTLVTPAIPPPAAATRRRRASPTATARRAIKPPTTKTRKPQ